MKRKPAIGVLDLGASGGRVFAFVRQGDRLRPIEVYRFEHTYQSYPQSNASTETIALCRCWDLPRIFGELKEGLRAISARDDLELVSFGIDSWGSDGIWINDQGDMLGMVGTGRDDRWIGSLSEGIQMLKHGFEQEVFLPKDREVGPEVLHRRKGGKKPR